MTIKLTFSNEREKQEEKQQKTKNGTRQTHTMQTGFVKIQNRTGY